jgi:Zn-dependent peptidase ImmA (M78 family)/DNA-binding XRE family transcriptional regulator
MFNPTRLSLARQRRRLTGRALADAAGVTADTISRLEKGSNEPDDATVLRLSDALGYPVEFFYLETAETIDTGAVSFRSFSKMSAKERDAAVAAGALGLQLSAWVDERFSLPAANVPDFSDESRPDAAAFRLRQSWGLGEKPIGNLIGLLETQGVRVFSLSEDTASVNAFSFWMDGRPFIFLNNFKSAESSMFDAAHELGHLVMHRHGDPKETRAHEKEANSFAAAFLMPEADVRARVPSLVTLDYILAAKKRWRVSAMALAHRLRSIYALSDWQYKSICIELSKRGYRSSEPDGIDRETSLIWKKIFEQLWRERITKHDVASDLRIPLDELEGLIWEITSVSRRPAKGKPNLSVL